MKNRREFEPAGSNSRETLRGASATQSDMASRILKFWCSYFSLTNKNSSGNLFLEEFQNGLWIILSLADLLLPEHVRQPLDTRREVTPVGAEGQV
jgi:hypothetical protein